MSTFNTNLADGPYRSANPRGEAHGQVSFTTPPREAGGISDAPIPPAPNFICIRLS
jgi:hypothetical protein